MANPIRELVIKVTVDASGAKSGFGDVDKAQEKTSTSSVALGNVIANLTTKVVETGIAAAKAAVSYAIDLVTGTAEAADATAKLSKQLGVNAQQLQRLSGAAQLSGADVGSLDKGVRVLTKGLAAASLTGTGPAVDALETLGLTVEDLSGDIESGNIEGLVGTIGDAFNETGDSIEKSAALMQLFGGAGTKLRPLLEEGSEGVAALGDQIKNVISDEDLAQFEGLVDEQFLLEDAMAGLKNEIAVGLAPVVSDIVGRFTTFIDENEELIKQDLPTFIGFVADGMIALTDIVFETIESWREFIADVERASEAFEQDFPEAVGAAVTALEVVDQVATDVGDSVERVVNFILDAISKLEGLESTVASIKAGLGIDEEATTERGAPAFAGGGTNLVATTKLTPDNTSADLQRVITGNFSEADKAIARDSLPIARQRETLIAARAEGDRLRAARDADAQKAVGRDARARRRAGTQRKRARGGGKGGGGKAAAEEPSIDDLLAGAIGAATGQPSQVASSDALAGTMLISVDQSINVTQGPVTIALEVPAGIAESGDIEALADLLAERFIPVSALTVANDFFEGRQNVGGG